MSHNKKGSSMQTPEHERTMITFRKTSYRFTYRIGGIALHNDRVLCQKSTINASDIYWFLPGGRAELGESSAETLRREMLEELGETVQVGRLLYVIENFFVGHEEQHHEVGFYFEIAFPDSSYLYQDNVTSFVRPEEDHLPLLFDWLPLTELAQTQALRPLFFNAALQKLPATTQHIMLLDDIIK
jgi:ADP-ribose pyrophosphatase